MSTRDDNPIHSEAAALEIIELEQFDTAFAVSANQSAAVRRRFMTLFVDSRQTRLYGSSGTVSKAHNALGETFAIKRLRPDSGATPPLAHGQSRFSETQLSAFREEYRAQIQISHMKGFPRLYGYGTADGDPVIIMEWVEGKTLDHARQLLPKRDGADAIEPHVVAQIGRDLFSILEGLEMLVERPVHRDLSPSNIMIRTSDRPLEQQVVDGSFDICLIDFGSATVLGSPDPRLTLSANIWRNGTPEYAPPEMLTLDVAGIELLRQSPSIDVYAVASVLYELLCARTPFRMGERADESSPYRIKCENAPDPLDDDFGALGAAIVGSLQIDQDRRPSAGRARNLCIDYLNGATSGSAELVEELLSGKAIPAEQREIPPVADFEMAHLSMPNANGKTPGTAAGKQGPGPLDRPVSRRSFIVAAAIGIAAIGGIGYGLASNANRASDNSQTGSDSSSAIKTASYTGGTLYAAQDPDSMLWGFLNSQRLWVIEPRFANAGLFAEGLAAVVDPETDRIGFVDYEGNWAIEPQFDSSGIQGFSPEGLACVVSVQGFDLGGGEANRAGWIDKTGAWAIAPRFIGGGLFQNGLAACSSTTGDRDQKLWGFIDTSGAFVIPEVYRDCGAFSDEGLACAKASTARFGWIDREGNWAIEAHYGLNRKFSEGLAAAMDGSTERWGFVNASDEVVVGHSLGDARWFSGGRASCQDAASKLWGMIDANGNWAIKPAFAKLGEISHGLAPAQDDESKLYGYIDDQGEWVIPPQFANVGLASLE